eukprot:1454485-Rhodomonas_salina.1
MVALKEADPEPGTSTPPPDPAVLPYRRAVLCGTALADAAVLTWRRAGCHAVLRSHMAGWAVLP